MKIEYSKDGVALSQIEPGDMFGEGSCGPATDGEVDVDCTCPTEWCDVHGYVKPVEPPKQEPQKIVAWEKEWPDGSGAPGYTVARVDSHPRLDPWMPKETIVRPLVYASPVREPQTEVSPEVEAALKMVDMFCEVGHCGDGTRDAARTLAAEVRRLRAAAEQPAPQQGWRPFGWVYQVNGTWTAFVTDKPPDDAYDEGTLTQVFAAPSPPGAES